MGGYEPERTTYTLDFDDAGMPGLLVKTHAPPLGVLVGVVKMVGETDAAGAMGLFGTFAEYLVSWNVTQGGKAVPATYEGLLTQETPFVIKIVKAWVGAMAGVDPTLSPPSTAGGNPEETGLQIPVEPLPENPPS